MEKSEKKSLSLAAQILIALVLAIIVGLLLGKGAAPFLNNYIKPIGTIFLNLIKFVVVPIVLFSITCGIMSMKDVKRVGSIGWKTVVYYLITTLFALVIGIAFAYAFKGAFPQLSVTDLTYEAKTANFVDTIVNIFPSNFITPLANATMLQVIVIALFLGISIVIVGEKAKPLADVIEAADKVFIKMLDGILKVSPVAVFCLLAPVMADKGAEVLGSLALVLLCAYIAYIVHAVVVYSGSAALIAKMSPVAFFKGVSPATIFAFASTSSVATLPINIDCCKKMGASDEVASFVLPLGATINMDGTAIYQGVCAVFIAACYGIDLTFGQIVTIIITATLASIGTAGVSGAGMVMLAMVLTSVGLPVEGIALVAGIDKLFDMGRTAINVTGDAACAMCISKIDEKKNNKK